MKLSSFQKILLASVILLVLVVLILSQSTFAKRIGLPAGLFEMVRDWLASGAQLSACDYKDGEILLIKPIATGVGEGRYEAGDIVEIRDGQTLCERFGHGNFLGNEERTQLLPVYYPHKLTEEEKKMLLEPEYTPSVIPAQAGIQKESEIISGSPIRSGMTKEREQQKLLLRRQVGLDYAQFLSDRDILKVRSFQPLDRLPEIDLSNIIDKKTGISLNVNPNDKAQMSNQIQSPNFKDRLLSYLDFSHWSLICNLKFDICNSGRDGVVKLPFRVAIYEKTKKALLTIARSVISPVIAQGSPTEVVKTVDTGGYADYLSLNAWEAGQQADLTALNQIRVATCRHATATSTADTVAVTITGWTTDATRYIKIWTDPNESYRHSGKWDTGKYRLEVSEQTPLSISEEYVRVDGLQIKLTSTGTFDYGIALTATDPCDIRISNNLIVGVLSGSSGNNYGIIANWNASGSRSAKIWNNIIYDFIRDSADVKGMWLRAGWAAYVYNNTVYNSYQGFVVDTSNNVAKNNISYNNTDNYSGTFHASSTNNLSGPTQTDAPGSNPKNGVTVQFVDAANKDFHLRVGDSAARGGGANLTLDSGSLAGMTLGTDIDGESRPETGAWDIGADEVARTTQINTPLSGRFKDSSLVGYWSFDGPSMNSGQALDDSGNNNTGTLYGGVKKVPGISGQALSFDGSDDYVSVADNPDDSLDFSTAFTISVWGNQTSVIENSGLVSKYLGASGGRGYAVRTQTTNEIGVILSADGEGSDTDSSVNDCGFTSNGEWTYITVTFDSGNIIYYKNGSQCDTDTNTVTSIFNNARSLNIGRYNENTEFNGPIDEVRIYNRVLSASEIAEQYRAGAARMKVNTPITLAGPTSGLVGNWTFNGQDTTWTSATAGTTADKSGNNNTGTMTNMSRSSSPAIGISGQALSFDGVDDYVVRTDANLSSNFPGKNGTTNNGYSFAAWFKFNSLATNEVIMRKPSSWQVVGEDADTVEWGLVTDGGNTYLYTSTSLQPGAWYYLVGTWNGSFMNLYLNGILEDGPTARGNTLAANANSFSIGGVTYFDGLIDEVRVYNRALSADEVLQLYQIGSRKVKF